MECNFIFILYIEHTHTHTQHLHQLNETHLIVIPIINSIYTNPKAMFCITPQQMLKYVMCELCEKCITVEYNVKMSIQVNTFELGFIKVLRFEFICLDYCMSIETGNMEHGTWTLTALISLFSQAICISICLI